MLWGCDACNADPHSCESVFFLDDECRPCILAADVAHDAIAADVLVAPCRQRSSFFDLWQYAHEAPAVLVRERCERLTLEHAVALHLLVEREVFLALLRLFHKQGIKRQLHGLSVLHLVGAGHAAGLIIDERETNRKNDDTNETAGEGPIVSITAFGLHLHFAHAP